MTTKQFLAKERVPVFGWTEGVQVEEVALQQLKNIASLPFIHHHVAAMPDVHWGMGATVGSVIPTESAIIPAAVGVDIGCGMMAVRTTIRAEHLPDNLSIIRSDIEAAVPHGRTNDGQEGDRGSWGNPPVLAQDRFAKLESGLKEITDKYQKLERAAKRAPQHIGTLGTGNHFIELCLDEAGFVWVMLHSGSRGIGNAIGTHFINLAKQEMRRWHINLPDEDLAYLPEGSEYFSDYVQGVHWAQNFAKANRMTMMDAVLLVLKKHFPDFECTEEAVNCHHNYVNKEKHFGKHVWLTRKGAVSAKAGELGIIPGSMGAKSFIVRGKGNHESFHSCSHGAGRKMSRGQAKKEITMEQHIADTEGVECRKDIDVIDESPRAYKDIDAVMAAQSELVDIVHTLKQIVCVKG